MRRLFALLASSALVLAACAGAPAASTTTQGPGAPPGGPSGDNDPTTTMGAGPTTTASDGAPSMPWNRVPDDATFGGDEDQVMSAVVEGGPGLVAVGWDVATRSAAVWTSTDGLSWSRVPHDESVFGGNGSQWMFGVAVGGPGLVAVGADSSGFDRAGAVWTSTDGLSWSRVPHDETLFGGDVHATINDVTSGGPGLVAVGWAGRPDTNAAVWTSSDGLSWSRVSASGAALGGEGTQEMRSVVAGGSVLVAVGRDVALEQPRSDGAVWTSGDGITWSRVAAPGVLGGEDDQDMLDVVAAGPGFVAVGLDWRVDNPPDAAVWTSVDGTTWSRVPHDDAVFGGSSYQQMMSIARGGPGLVAVGLSVQVPGEGNEAAVWVSPDGLSWRSIPYDEAVFGGEGEQTMNDLAGFGSLLIAVGSSGPISSLDGAIWTFDAAE